MDGGRRGPCLSSIAPPCLRGEPREPRPLTLPLGLAAPGGSGPLQPQMIRSVVQWVLVNRRHVLGCQTSVPKYRAR